MSSPSASHTNSCLAVVLQISSISPSITGGTATAYKLESGSFDFVIFVEGNTKIDAVSYKDALGRVITHTEEKGNLVKRDGYYAVTNISAAYIDNVMTISVGAHNGTYSLAKYISNCTDSRAEEVALAILTYSRAAENYKNITTFATRNFFP